MSWKLVGAEYIWRDGEVIRWEDATVHLLSTAVQFGTSMFEGIKCYDTPKGPCVFRLDAHVERLLHSSKIYRMEPVYTRQEIIDACLVTVARNNLKDCYIRPMVLRGYGSAGLDPRDSPIETYVAAWPWGAYLGEDALEKGVDVGVSSWNRPAPNTFPVQAKAAGHYNNAQLIKMEAVTNGYSEGLVLSTEGRLSEGGGQNVFLVRGGALVTPQLDGSLLRGITRDAVVKMATDLGIEVQERPVPREDLYTADEVFFTGTASEVTPIRSVDRITVGEGKPGPVTKAVQQRFLGVAKGTEEDLHGWLTPVYP
jgi:branched-chain amino acid aminotransferase